MKKKELILITLLFVGITVIFFYKTIFFSLVPIPGDLLIAEYNPWKSYSYLGYTPGSFPNKAQYFDVLRQLLPWKHFAVESIKSGTFPLWNPYNFSGTPLFANFQSALLYPLNIVYFIFPFINSWSFLIILQPFLALFFTYLFARKIGITLLGSLMSAVSYSFSFFFTVWLEYNTIGHVILWLPLSLLAVEQLREKVSKKWILGFVISLTFPIFAGHPQLYFYLFLFIWVYIIFRIQKEKIKLSLFFILSLLSIGIGAVQILPGLELIKQSARVAYDYQFFIQKILIQPHQLLMLVIPDFFGNPATRNYFLQDTYIGKVTSIGIVALLFIFFAAVKNNVLARFFLGSAIVIGFLTTVNPFSLFFYKLNLPFISSSSPTLSIYLLCFSLAILSGFGVEEFVKKKYTLLGILRKNMLLIVLFLCLIFILFITPQILLLTEKSTFWTALRNTSYGAVLFGVTFILLCIGTLREKWKVSIVVLLLLLQLFDLWRGFQKYNPFSPIESVFPKAEVFEQLKEKQGIDRVWGYGFASTEPNFETFEKLYSPQGYDPLYSRQYGSFLYASKDGKLLDEFSRITRADALVAPADAKDLLQNKNRLKILDALSVKYILDRVENTSHLDVKNPERFKLLYNNNGWLIYENVKAAPRALLTSNIFVYDSSKSFEKIFFSESFNPSSEVLLEKNVQIKNSDTKSAVKTISYSGNKKEFQTDSTSSSVLVLSDSYYPGWKVFVNGVELEILKANYTFQAVQIPSGNHRIEFRYEPQSFRIGLRISLVSLTGVLLLLFFIPERFGYNQKKT